MIAEAARGKAGRPEGWKAERSKARRSEGLKVRKLKVRKLKVRKLKVRKPEGSKAYKVGTLRVRFPSSFLVCAIKPFAFLRQPFVL